MFSLDSVSSVAEFVQPIPQNASETSWPCLISRSLSLTPPHFDQTKSVIISIQDCQLMKQEVSWRPASEIHLRAKLSLQGWTGRFCGGGSLSVDERLRFGICSKYAVARGGKKGGGVQHSEFISRFICVVKNLKNRTSFWESKRV